MSENYPVLGSSKKGSLPAKSVSGKGQDSYGVTRQISQKEQIHQTDSGKKGGYKLTPRDRGDSPEIPSGDGSPNTK